MEIYFREFYDEYGWDSYQAKSKLSNGQTAIMTFCSWWNQSKKRSPILILFNVHFEIKSKRKNKYIRNKQTGKCGLEGLLWAKKVLIFFESFIVNENYNCDKIIIHLGWDDVKRKKVYQYGLKDLDYKIGNINNCKVLLKELKNE